MILFKFSLISFITICLEGINGECDLNDYGDVQQIGYVVKYRSAEQLTLHQIKQHLKKRNINERCETSFCCLLVLRKYLKQKRNRREAEGSGKDDYEQYDYDDDKGGEIIKFMTITPAETWHAHRHHHGVEKTTSNLLVNADEIDAKSNVFTTTPVSTGSTTQSIPILSETSTTLEKEDTSSATAFPMTTILIKNNVKESKKVVITQSNSAEGIFQNIATSINHFSKASLISPGAAKISTSPSSWTTSLLSPSTTEYEDIKITNSYPILKTRLPKYTVISGKPFKYEVPLETFYDNEDGFNLNLKLFNRNGSDLSSTSWVQFNSNNREIYGLAMEDSVSKWQYKLEGIDSRNNSVAEIVEISVYQHKGLRIVNHEFSVVCQINEANLKNVDWQIMLIEAIAKAANDKNSAYLVSREVIEHNGYPHLVTLKYFNESLPTASCPENELIQLTEKLNEKLFSDVLLSKLAIKSVSGQLVGSCQKKSALTENTTFYESKSYPPVPRNQVDRVNATVGHLLVYKVPSDTFYDPNDNSELKLYLLTMQRQDISIRHWLQFDSRNQEFYGIPRSVDYGSQEYILKAENSNGLSASDALVVVVNHAVKRDFSVYFKVYLGIRHEQFTAFLQRKFVENISLLFGDFTTDLIQIRSITTHHDSDSTIVNYFNTTLFKSNNRCPDEKIEAVKNTYFLNGILREKVHKIIGIELNLINVQVILLGSCNQMSIEDKDVMPVKTEKPNLAPPVSDNYLLLFILPTTAIIVIILIATLFACFAQRRRVNRKMDIGEEEERKSFRPKGIPVIFQDELDEKLDISNKSPIILKNEKPPLLPPSYNETSMDGENDMDEYVPPPAVVCKGREIRGKFPATPSYRKPPPYVSP